MTGYGTERADIRLLRLGLGRAGVRTRTAAAALVLTVAIVPGAQPAGTPGASVCTAASGEAVLGEAGAASLAHRCERPIEVLDARTPSLRLFANPDGTRTAEIATQPQRVRRPDGRWVGIDPTLKADRDGVSAVAVPGALRFSGGGSAPLVELSQGAARFTLGWPDPLPPPMLSGPTATYPEVLPGVDLLVRATPTGFTHLLSVKSAAAAANPRLAAIAYPLGGSGVSTAMTAAGGVRVTTVDGTPLAWSDGALMWDSSAAPHQAPAALRIDNGHLVVVPDRALLDDPATRYPVFIDPPFSYVTGTSQWAYADDADATNDTVVARVGRDPDSGVLYRSFFQFPTSSGGYTLAGSRIISAKVNAVLYHSWSCSPTPVSLWRTGSIMSTPRTAWSPGLSQFLDTESANAHKGDNDCGNQPDATMTFTGGLAADLQARVNAGDTSYTVGLSARDADGTGETTTQRWKKFFPSTVTLTVTYDHAPATPALSDLSMDPSYRCGASPIYINGASGITLRARLSDVDGDTIWPQFSIPGVAAGYVHPSGAAVSGEFTATVEAGGLADGGAYSWTVRGYDGLDTGGTSPACPFVVDNSVPGKPAVSAPELAAGTAAVGRPSAVSVSPASGGGTTTAGYLIGVGVAGTPIPTIWVPANANGTATATVVPVAAGSNTLSVQARNLAGQVGGVVAYPFQALAQPVPVPHVKNDSTGDGKADPVLVTDVDGGRVGLWRWASTGSTVLAPTTPMGFGGYDRATTQLFSGDFDGDGRTDRVLFNQTAGAPLAVSVGLSDGNANPAVAVDTTGWSATTLSSMKPVIGDFTGDGRDDLGFGYLVSSTQWNIYVAPSSSSAGAPSFGPLALWTVNSGSTFGAAALVAGDFTGDGRADVLEATDAGSCTTNLYLHTSTGSALSTGVQKWTSGANGLCWSAAKFLAADFNGDGHADLAALVDRGSCQTDLRTWYAKADGSGLNAPSTPWSAGGVTPWCQAQMARFAGDVTGDGKADIAVAYTGGDHQVRLWIYTATGSGFAAPTLWWEGGLGPLGTGSVRLQPGARYQLVPTFSGQCMGIAGSSTADGTPFTERACSASALNMQVTFDRAGGASVKIHPAHATGKCLDIAGPVADDWTQLHQWGCYSALNQVWQLSYVGGTGDVIVQLRSDWSDKCADVQHAAPDPGTPWIEFTCHSGDPQQYYLRLAS
jgi:hypothetical protein